jgi:hypothetical protein
MRGVEEVVGGAIYATACDSGQGNIRAPHHIAVNSASLLT